MTETRLNGTTLTWGRLKEIIDGDEEVSDAAAIQGIDLQRFLGSEIAGVKVSMGQLGLWVEDPDRS